MPDPTKDFVLNELAFFITKRSEFLTDVREAPETAQERIWQMEDLRGMAVKVDLSADYIALVDELIVDLRAIQGNAPESTGTIQ